MDKEALQLKTTKMSTKTPVIKQIAEKIRQSERIAITSHIRPDADSIGSGLALYHIINALGKDVFYFNTDKAPYPLTDLPGFHVLRQGQIYPGTFDAIILVEGCTEERTGMTHLDDYFTINIDHHASSSFNCDINWVDTSAAAVGELMYELACELGVPWTREIGFNIYAAISSDTGSFKYSNATAKSLKIASHLVKECRFAPVEVSDLLFNSNPLEKVRMIQKVLSTLDLRLGNRIAIIDFKREFLDELSLKDIETEDVIALARSIRGVDVTLFFKEIGNAHFRVSIRSRGEINSQEVATTFSGGGHAHAAGFFYNGTIDSAKRDILAAIQKQIK
ncbi:MAG: bifunctional oligoribonuclease/PAP phosphatase NrnA [bacterium]|nr:bifunctional oligoribonuclease/PAP phosphatase NrnA [bacterium]